MTGATAPPFSLHWLPPASDIDSTLSEIRHNGANAAGLFQALQSVANHRLDFVQTNKLDRLLNTVAPKLPPGAPRIRLSLQGSATLAHLLPAIRAGALRRGLLAEIQVGPFGLWRQQALDPTSDLYRFKPDVVLFMLERDSILPDLPFDMRRDEVASAVGRAVDELTQVWQAVTKIANAQVIQQTLWSSEPAVFGQFDRLLPAGPRAVMLQLNRAVEEAAARERTFVLDLDSLSSEIGARVLGDSALWHHAKQAISPLVAPLVGDIIGRLLAAIRGLSKKVLVLDLDNTLWGGVIGDDGLEGIQLGSGSARGEAFLAFQRYVKRLAERGVILAASSKNDPVVAEAAIRNHPEMILRMDDFSCFEVDWNDKPAALRRIARQLDLGIDSLVFVDDNPVERALVRKTLPQVAVPELAGAPELYARAVADAGYFEAVSFTSDDRKRNRQYASNRERAKLRAAATDLDGFLRELQMTLTISPFTAVDIPRITQLINKTNQFNLTTRRYTEAEVTAMMGDPSVLARAARLKDRFGDNGLATVVIGRRAPNGADDAIEIDTWLMSCRVLGRRVEEAMLTAFSEDAQNLGVMELIGRYVPSPRNEMVRNHYARLGFTPLRVNAPTEETLWTLSLLNAKLPVVDYVNVVRAG